MPRDGATELYQRLVGQAVHRGRGEDWYELGCFLNEMRKWGAAAGCFGRAAGLLPGDHRAWCNLGWMRHLQGDPAGAELGLRRAIALAPGVGMPRALLCQVLAAFRPVGRTSQPHP